MGVVYDRIVIVLLHFCFTFKKYILSVQSCVLGYWKTTHKGAALAQFTTYL